MVYSNDTDHIQEILKLKREALHVLEEKIALYPPAEVPEFLVIQRKVLQDEIAELEARQKILSRAIKERKRKLSHKQVPETKRIQREKPSEMDWGTWDEYRMQIIVAAMAALAVVLAAMCGLFPGAVTEITEYLLSRPTSVAVMSSTVELTSSPGPVSTDTPTLSPTPELPPTHARPTATSTPIPASTSTLTFTPIPPTSTPTLTPTPLASILLQEPQDGSVQKWEVALRWQFRDLKSDECFSVRAWPYALGKENIKEEDRCFHQRTSALEYSGGLGSCFGKVWWEVAFVPASCDIASNDMATITSEPGWFFYELPPLLSPSPTPSVPILIAPENGAIFKGEVVLEWSWIRELEPDEYFAVRGHPPDEEKSCFQEHTKEPLYRGGVGACPDGIIWWSISVVRSPTESPPWEEVSGRSAERWFRYSSFH